MQGDFNFLNHFFTRLAMQCITSRLANFSEMLLHMAILNALTAEAYCLRILSVLSARQENA